MSFRKGVFDLILNWITSPSCPITRRFSCSDEDLDSEEEPDLEDDSFAGAAVESLMPLFASPFLSEDIVSRSLKEPQDLNLLVLEL